MARQDWIQAEALAERDLEIARAGQLNDYERSLVLHAVAAGRRCATAMSPEPRTTSREPRACGRCSPPPLPHRAVQALLELARAHLALTDVAGARILLREARYILRQRPHLGILPLQAARLQSKVDSLLEATTGPARLTTAELRLLPLLSTHFTFREISECLYLSPHTVKSQALSVYRKLGVSSRSQAIQRMRRTGLLPVGQHRNRAGW
jgi:LuxR family maltose regulon positive regulatory protein